MPVLGRVVFWMGVLELLFALLLFSTVVGMTSNDLGRITEVGVAMNVLWRFAKVGVVGMSALFHIANGPSIQRFRRRSLGIASLLVGLPTIIGCWCFLPNLALCVAGLIVLLHPVVSEGFRLVAAGATVPEMRARLSAP